MINTLDSMTGYKNDRFRHFDISLLKSMMSPTLFRHRLTAFLMVMVSGKIPCSLIIRNYGREHASPNKWLS